MGLNRTVRGLPDGTVIASVELWCWNEVKPHVGRVRVYWPFVTFQDARGPYNITHAPTGSWVHSVKNLKAAQAWIAQARAVADWDFRSPRSRKAQATKRAARHLLPRLQQIG